MHEELSRPLLAKSSDEVCDCTCAASVSDGESAGVESVRQSNYLATKNDIGG